KSAQIREILISESAWEEMTCLFAPSLALCSIHHKAFDKGSLGVDENMRVQISSAVNGNSVVSRFFWDFAGAQIHLPLQKENYPQDSYIECVVVN
ncbi:hypothetical protein ACT02E_23575, partial [Enterobacter asburiae]